MHAECAPPNWVSLSEMFSWHFMKDPIAISTAVLVGVLIAILSNSFDPSNTFNLVWIVTTVLLIMIYGTAERVLVEAVFRMVGTTVGVGVGALLAFGEGEMEIRGGGGVAQYSYELSLQVVIVFLVAIVSRLFPALGNIPFFAGLTAAILIFSPDLAISYQRTLSVLLAVAVCLLCTIVFHYTMADELLFKEHRIVASHVLKVTEWAISFKFAAKDEFDRSTSLIRTALAEADIVWEAYVQWRRFTLRKPLYDFKYLTEALRPLYYESYSIYWRHAETALRPSDSQVLYCDSETDFETLFRPLITNIAFAVRDFREMLEVLIQPTRISPRVRCLAIERLIEDIGHSMFLNLELLSMRYVDNRLTCFSTRTQRWCMCDYMISLACVLMELIEYVKRIVSFFSSEDISRYQDYQTRLSHLKERLNTLKYESRLILDITPALSHAASIGEFITNPDHRRSERRFSSL